MEWNVSERNSSLEFPKMSPVCSGEAYGRISEGDSGGVRKWQGKARPAGELFAPVELHKSSCAAVFFFFLIYSILPYCCYF